MSDILRLNKIKHPDQIVRGQTFRVPDLMLLPQASKDNTSVSSATVFQNSNTLNKDVRLVANHSVDKVNRNRPAFLPIALANEATDISKIGIITVDFDETLSHYADWSKSSLRKIFRLNGMHNRSRLNIHSKIKIPFINVHPDRFSDRRQEYHKAIQEAFFSNYQINKLLVRNIFKGETVWEICNEIYSIPFWLLASYNPDKDINSISSCRE